MMLDYRGLGNVLSTSVALLYDNFAGSRSRRTKPGVSIVLEGIA
jgi:hypothetical protein